MEVRLVVVKMRHGTGALVPDDVQAAGKISTASSFNIRAWTAKLKEVTDDLFFFCS